MSHLSCIPKVAVKRQNRNRSRLASAFVFAVLCATGVIISGEVARSGEYEPIGIVTDSILVTGEPLQCQVDLDGPSAGVTVYSNPPGAVSFQGVVQDGQIIEAVTNPNLNGVQSVTVYAITDGQRVVSTMTAVYSDNIPNMPHHP